MNISEYYQPDFYHFCENTIKLADEASKLLSSMKDFPDVRVLDLCSGCGVVGMEILARLSRPVRVDFLELQVEFNQYFKRNLSMFPKEYVSNMKLINGNFTDKNLLAEMKGRYDLVVSNPPFYLSDKARLGTNEKKNICRFFIRGLPPQFWEFCFMALKDDGNCLVLTKDDVDLCPHRNNFSWNVLDRYGDHLLVLASVLDKNGC